VHPAKTIADNPHLIIFLRKDFSDYYRDGNICFLLIKAIASATAARIPKASCHEMFCESGE